MLDLAHAVGLKSYQAVQQWETTTAPNRKRAPLVAKALGVSVNYLVTGQDSQAPGINVFIDNSKPDAMEDEIATLMRRMSPIGRGMLMERARVLAEMYPLNKQITSCQ